MSMNSENFITKKKCTCTTYSPEYCGSVKCWPFPALEAQSIDNVAEEGWSEQVLRLDKKKLPDG